MPKPEKGPLNIKNGAEAEGEGGTAASEEKLEPKIEGKSPELLDFGDVDPEERVRLMLAREEENAKVKKQDVEKGRWEESGKLETEFNELNEKKKALLVQLGELEEKAKKFRISIESAERFVSDQKAKEEEVSSEFADDLKKLNEMFASINSKVTKLQGELEVVEKRIPEITQNSEYLWRNQVLTSAYGEKEEHDKLEKNLEEEKRLRDKLERETQELIALIKKNEISVSKYGSIIVNEEATNQLVKSREAISEQLRQVNDKCNSQIKEIEDKISKIKKAPFFKKSLFYKGEIASLNNKIKELKQKLNQEVAPLTKNADLLDRQIIELNITGNNIRSELEARMEKIISVFDGLVNFYNKVHYDAEKRDELIKKYPRKDSDSYPRGIVLDLGKFIEQHKTITKKS